MIERERSRAKERRIRIVWAKNRIAEPSLN